MIKNFLNLTRKVRPKIEFDKSNLSDLAIDYVIKNKKFKTVLDIGSGSGVHANYFDSKGKIVTRFDFGKSRAFTDNNSDVIVGDFIEHSFHNTYDLVWASHVLEHTIHTHEFLVKIKKVTNPNGVVAITVPPAKSQFVGGHVTLWTPALLIYRMVLAGFDCSNAKIMSYGYNISIICENVDNDLSLENLYWDFNDLERIKKYLPEELDPKIDGSKFGDVYKDAQVYFK